MQASKNTSWSLLAHRAFATDTFSVMFQADQTSIDFGLYLLSRPDTVQVVIDLYLLGAMACLGLVG